MQREQDHARLSEAVSEAVEKAISQAVEGLAPEDAARQRTLLRDRLNHHLVNAEPLEGATVEDIVNRAILANALKNSAPDRQN